MSVKSASYTALGIDVGGTKIAAGCVTFPQGIVQIRREIPTLPHRGGEAVLADVVRLVTELSSECRAAGQRVKGIGLGVCEIVNLSGQLASANCLDWPGEVAQRRLSSFAPTLVEADVRAAAYAEAMFGAGKAARIFLYVSIGTGISCCLVIDGQPFTGVRGASGTMASAPFPNFNETRILRNATLEEIASGPALVTRFVAQYGKATSAQDVLSAAAAENESAVAVVRSAAEALGSSIGWLVNVLDPELVVLGGGLGLSEGLFRQCLIDSARRHIWWDGHRDIPIISAATSSDAGLIGAAACAWREFCPR